MDELFDLVDENDRVMGVASRRDVHSKGYVHRSVLFYLLDKEMRVFVNQRSASKEFYPGYWSIVLGGHLRAGESYDDAVLREAKEEADVDGRPVYIASYKRRFGDTDKENSRVYGFLVNRKLKLEQSEIKRGEFMTLDELDEKLKKEKFLPETQDLYKILREFFKEKRQKKC